MDYETAMTATEIAKWDYVISQYGFFSWGVAKSFLGVMVLFILWIACFFNFTSMFTTKGRIRHAIMVQSGLASYNYGATLVSSWFISWFVGIFAHTMLFDSVVGYFLHSALPTDFLYTVEASTCKFLTLAGFFYA